MWISKLCVVVLLISWSNYALSADDPCIQYSTCDTCVVDSSCGFCYTTGKCSSGSALGPAVSNCSGWSYGSCHCYFANDCHSCSGFSKTCVWCQPLDAAGVCFPVSFSGNASCSLTWTMNVCPNDLFNMWKIGTAIVLPLIGVAALVSFVVYRIKKAELVKQKDLQIPLTKSQ